MKYYQALNTQNRIYTDQNSTTTNFEKATTKCFKLLGYGSIEDEVDISVNKFMPAI